jgi:FkbM family methyltransferase
LQYEGSICYYIDCRPNYNLSIEILDFTTKTNFGQYKPKLGDVILDIGAGVGTETLIYSMRIGNGKVFAIEAHPETYNSLNYLVELNGFKNIFVSNIAISDLEGIVYIDNKDNHVENAILINEKSGIPINAYTLDKFVRSNNIYHIDYLKMNIEGSEYNAINGMKNTINMTDFVAISCHDFLFSKSSGIIKKTITDFLLSNGFTLTWKETGDIIQDSWIYGHKANL